MSSDSWWVFLERSMWCGEEKRGGSFSCSSAVILCLVPTLNWMKFQAQRFDMSFAKCHNLSLLLWRKMRLGRRGGWGRAPLDLLGGGKLYWRAHRALKPARRHTLEWLAECEAGKSQQLLQAHLQYSQILSAPPAKLALAVEYVIWWLSGMWGCAASKYRTEVLCMLLHGHDPHLSAASLDSIHISQENSRSHLSRSSQLHTE